MNPFDDAPSIDKIRCAECQRSFIHAMTCSKYGTAAPLSPAQITYVMRADPGAYVAEQYAHTGDLSRPSLAELAARNGDRRFLNRGIDDGGVRAYFAQPLLSIPIEPEKITAVVAWAKKITAEGWPNPFDEPVDTFPG